MNYMKNLRVTQTYACLDLFGASGRVADAFISKGYPAVSYDIKLSAAHDVCSEHGFKYLCALGLEFLGCSIGFSWFSLNCPKHRGLQIAH